VQEIKMFLCVYTRSAAFTYKQLFLLVFNVILPVKHSYFKYLIRQLHSLAGYAVILAHSTEDAFPVISADNSYTFLLIIRECNSMGRTDICTGLAADTLFIIYNRLAPEPLKRHMRLLRELGCISRSNKGDNSFLLFSEFRILHLTAS